MTYFEPVCPHPQEDWEYLDCGCIQCSHCGDVVYYCNSAHCELADYETAYTDEDVEDWDDYVGR